MKIATDEQHRILAFVEACNRSGYLPTPDEVRAWLRRPVPLGAVVGSGLVAGLITLQAGLAKVLGEQTIRDAEDPVDHLCALGWLREQGGSLSISPLGTAMLAAAERSDEQASDAAVVVLDRDDPIAYPRLIGHLASLGPGLLLDPYFRLESLMHILDGTRIDRILVSKQHRDSKEVRGALALAVTSATLPRPIEIRASADNAIHDRLFLADAGAVHTLGSSLNSIANGTVTTVVSPVPEPGATTLRKAVHGWWARADVVGAAAVADVAAVPGPAPARKAARKPAKRKPSP